MEAVNLNTVLIILLCFAMLMILSLILGYLRSLERKIDRLELKIAEASAEIRYLRQR